MGMSDGSYSSLPASMHSLGGTVWSQAGPKGSESAISARDAAEPTARRRPRGPMEGSRARVQRVHTSHIKVSLKQRLK